jgi:ABC-type dipeptide/oligopeptide/nickel transport system permease component
MLRFVGRRLALAVPNLFLISLIVFVIMHVLPGDPVKVMLAGTPVSGEQVEQLRAQLGLDDPLYVQYWRFVSGAVQGDLGRSITTKRTVSSEILSQFPATLQLTAAGMAVAVLLGLVSGVIAAIRQGTWVDAASMGLALIGISMPSFWLALLLLFLFSFKLGWVPATGAGGWRHLLLPAFVLGVGQAAIIARLVRASMVEVLRQDFVRVARAKGLRERPVIMGHALRNALLPVVTVLGLQYAFLLGGAVVIETVFGRPGIGRLSVDAILAKDFPVVQGTVLFTAGIYVLVNLLVDLSYAWIDPRVRDDLA